MASKAEDQAEKVKAQQEEAAKEREAKVDELKEKLKDPDLSEEEKTEVTEEIARLQGREPYRENPTQRAHREHDEREAKIDELIGEKDKEKEPDTEPDK